MPAGACTARRSAPAVAPRSIRVSKGVILLHENAEILPACTPVTPSELILGGPGGDDGRLVRRREGFPGEMAQAAPDIGARQGSRGQKRRVAQRRGRGGVCGLVRLGAFLAALPRAMVPTMVGLVDSGCERSVTGARIVSTCTV